MISSRDFTGSSCSMVTVVVTGHSSRRSTPSRWTPTGDGLQRGQFCWPPLGRTVGRQRAATWPPLGRISWPPTPRLAFDLFEAPVCRSACRRGYIVEVSAVLAGTATPERCDAPTGQGSHNCARGLLSCDSPSQEHDATQCGDSCCSLRLERHEAVTLRGHKKFLWSRTVCPGTFPAMRIGA